jgi:dienelactone hydrolase
MRHVRLLSFAVFLSGVLAAAAETAPPRRVDLNAPDGTPLAATYYQAAKPGPGILLLHQCNSDRSSWDALATQLSGKGFHVLTLDYRGYGQSGGTFYQKLTGAERFRMTTEKWPGDVDTALAFLRSMPVVEGNNIGAGGASCGVNQSIQLSRRHPEQVKSLVLLSGNTDRGGRKHLHSTKTLPLFLAAADDDEGVVQAMSWIDASSGNPANKFVQYPTGGHGTNMFKPHPELLGEVVAWYQATLTGKGATAPSAARARPSDPAVALLVMMDEPGGPARVAEQLTAEQRKNPKSEVLAPVFVNQLGYEAIQAQETKAAVSIMQINVDARPSSSNAWDSLGDAYLADGQREKAREASEKALALVNADASEPADRKELIRQSAQQKVDELKGAAPAPK